MAEQLNPEHVHYDTDVLILGTGGAGLTAALAASRAGADVLVVSKMGPDDPNCTIRAWGGFTYTTQSHEAELFRQVVETGGFLSNQRLVEVFVRDTPRRLQDMADLGIEMEVLDQADVQGRLGIIKLPSQADGAGFGMTRPLRAQAEALGARFVDNLMVSSLLLDHKQVVGATGVDVTGGEFVSIAAKAVVVATGGGARVYERTDNPAGTTGDGIALAYDAGAELVDMECVSFQFPRKRLEELFRVKQAPDEGLLRAGAAHYFLGGIKIDERCRTTVDGLYAAGEVTGGLLGAARLGGSAMADIIVFGAIAAREAAERAKTRPVPELNAASIDRERQRLSSMLSDAGAPADEVAARVRATMWRHCGTMKTRQTLERAIEELEARRPRICVASVAGLRQGIECSCMLTVAKLICAAALTREETRGCFWRLDFPQPDNANWLRNVHQWQASGEPRLEVRPAVMTRLTTPTQPRIGAGCFGYLP